MTPVVTGPALNSDRVFDMVDASKDGVIDRRQTQALPIPSPFLAPCRNEFQRALQTQAADTQ